MTHTRGAWVASKEIDSVGVARLYAKTIMGTPIAEVYAIHGIESDYNARLIAASPRLLEACKLASKFLNSGEPQEDKLEDIINDAIKGAT